MSAPGHRDIFASDIEWRKGTGEGILYAHFRTNNDDASSPAIVLSKFEPGTVVDAHTHDTNYFEYIIAGEQTVGKTLFKVGDVRIAEAGRGYGPIKVGPEGCTVLIVFEDGSGAGMVTLPRKKPAQATA
jgi:anti-sigma factor ChrR (cupin superfamily)